MTIFKAMLWGVAAALVATSAQAGKLEVLYWGDDRSATLEFDGYSYNLGDAVSINVEAGNHRMVLHANGDDLSTDINLNSGNAASPDYWCLDADDDDWGLLDAEDCDDMWEAYWDGY